ncbi:MAG: 16S rRNA (guanine(966)-N(2))-methyltransferase RsmD [Bacillota bacterium]
MRVIAGKYKGRNLKGPKHEGLRPTADRVKEALFNIIGARINGSRFLDLFAGSGGIGIEALSRGADLVVFNDANSSSIKLLRENLTIIDPEDRYRLFQLPAERALEILNKEGDSFDLIFLDPPFQAGLVPKTLAAIAIKKLLKEDGILIVEHPTQVRIENPEFTEFLSRKYGDIHLTFLKNFQPTPTAT